MNLNIFNVEITFFTLPICYVFPLILVLWSHWTYFSPHKVGLPEPVHIRASGASGASEIVEDSGVLLQNEQAQARPLCEGIFEHPSSK